MPGRCLVHSTNSLINRVVSIRTTRPRFRKILHKEFHGLQLDRRVNLQQSQIGSKTTSCSSRMEGDIAAAPKTEVNIHESAATKTEVNIHESSPGPLWTATKAAPNGVSHGELKPGAVERTQEDDPCWGSPEACSLSDLLQWLRPQKSDAEEAARPPAILFESSDYLVLNKPPDLRMDGTARATVHKLLTYWYPPPSLQNIIQEQRRQLGSESGNEESSIELWLQNFIMTHFHRHSDHVDNQLRPCHQLDYATSGALLVARHARAADQARQVFEHRQVRKTYLALVHGHIPRSTTSSGPVLSPGRVQQHLQQVEHKYRNERGKRRKDTWKGYLPASALFQHWLKQQRTQQEDEGHPPPRRKRKKEQEPFSEQDWQRVWSELQLQDTAEIERLRSSAACWKDAKAMPSVKSAFERAAVQYNQLLQQKYRESDTLGIASNHTLAVERPDLPTFFRASQENASEESPGEPSTTEAFYIWAPMAEVKHHFAMRIHPRYDSTVGTAPANGPSTAAWLPVGDESLDYKPCLTRCVVLHRTYSQGWPVTKVQLEPQTGRRHQLRVHMALSGHPIVGDCTYSRSQDASTESTRNFPRMCLHSYIIELPLPSPASSSHDPLDTKRNPSQFILRVKAPDPFPVEVEADAEVKSGPVGFA